MDEYIIYKILGAMLTTKIMVFAVIVEKNRTAVIVLEESKCPNLKFIKQLMRLSLMT